MLRSTSPGSDGPWARRTSVAPGDSKTRGGAILGLAGLIMLAGLVSWRRHGALGPSQAAVLGAVEGITEFLPVSSTGHLIVAERLLGLGRTPEARSALESYAVMIQGGAILAVGWLFRARLAGVLQVVRVAFGFSKRRVLPAGDVRLATAIAVAAAPTGLLGLAFGDSVKRHLFAPGPIALAWAVGGVALLLVTQRLRRKPAIGGRTAVPLELVTWRHALVIGFAQALALWPGVSRSLVTIAAGALAGLTLPAAVELSFLVGFFVLLGAAGIEVLREGGAVVVTFGWAAPLLGMSVAFVCAAAAIRWLVGVVSERSLAGFGWYRIGAAALTMALLAGGRL